MAKPGTMLMSLRPTLRAAVAALLATSAAALADPIRQVNVVTDMTAAGRVSVHPAPGAPVYYFPIVGGYHEMGETVDGEVPPDRQQMIHHLAEALARAGYFATRSVPPPSGHARPGDVTLYPPPSIVLAFNWGYLNPIVMQFFDDPGPTLMNEDQMLAMVAGNTLAHLPPRGWTPREQVEQRAWENRYFVTVSAYDFDAYIRQHRKVLLWVTKLSMASDSLTMPKVMPTIIATGTPYFGRETRLPEAITPNVPKVEVGQPEFKGYVQGPIPPTSPPPPAP